MILVKYKNGTALYYAKNKKSKDFRKLDTDLQYCIDTNWPENDDYNNAAAYKLSIKEAIKRGRLERIKIKDFTYSQKEFFMKAINENYAFKANVRNEFFKKDNFRIDLICTFPELAIYFNFYDKEKAAKAMDRLIHDVSSGRFRSNKPNFIEVCKKDKATKIFVIPNIVKKAMSEFYNKEVLSMKAIIEDNKFKGYILEI